MNRIIDLTTQANHQDTDKTSSVSGPPKKVEAEALKGVAGELVREILPHTEASEGALLFNLLTGFGSMAGRNRYIMAGNSRHYPNLFGVLVGATGKGRKGSSLNAFKPVFNRIDKNWWRDCKAKGLNSGEGLIYHVRDATYDKKGELEDIGILDKRLFVIEEEFASVLKRMKGQNNSLAAVMREAWDGEDLRSLIKNSPDRATAPHISIIGHCTKAELSDLISGTDILNGFANRFLWPYTERSKFLPDAGEIPLHGLNGAIEALQRSLEKVRNGDETEVPLEPEAAEIWRTEYRELSEGKPGLFGAVTGKAEAHVRRLSLDYALIDGESRVTAESMNAALAFWRYCEQSAEWLFGTPFNHPDADKIYEGLRKVQPKGMTKTDINRQLFSNHAGSQRLEEALTLLEKKGAAFPKTEKTAGADRERWFLTGAAN